MNSIDFSPMQFKTLGFAGEYRKLIGSPNKGCEKGLDFTLQVKLVIKVLLCIFLKFL